MRAAAPPWTRRSGIGPWGGGASPSGECSRCEHTRPVALVVAHDASEGGADSGGAGLRAGRVRDGDGDDQKRRVHAAPDRQLRPADGVRGCAGAALCVDHAAGASVAARRRGRRARGGTAWCATEPVRVRGRWSSCAQGACALARGRGAAFEARSFSGPKCGAAEQPAASYGGGDGLARRGPAGPARRRVR